MNAFSLDGPSLAPAASIPARRGVQPAAEDLVANAEWLAQGFEASGRAMQVVNVPRHALRDLSFLTDQALRDRDRCTIPLALVERGLADAEQVPVHYIFHSAFCGSTLLARALEALDGGASLKEPGLLTNLLYHLGQWTDGGNQRRIELAVGMLARPVSGAPTTIVKPSCFASSLAPTLLAARPSSRAIFLTGSLRDFLGAVAKRSIRGRAWARRAYSDAMRHMPFDIRFSAADQLELTDLQVAGLAWLMRTHFLRQCAAAIGPGRVFEVRFDDLAHSPESTLLRAARFIGAQVGEEEVRHTLAGPVFAEHAKHAGQPFTMADREREMSAALTSHREEIETVAGWIEAVAAGFGLSESGRPVRSAH